MKHTQGEWKIAKTALKEQTAVWVVGTRICIVDEVPHEGSEANAKLIAAAPDLLEALKIAQQYVNVFMIRNEEPLVGEALKDDSFKILSAIKKATE